MSRFALTPRIFIINRVQRQLRPRIFIINRVLRQLRVQNDYLDVDIT